MPHPSFLPAGHRKNDSCGFGFGRFVFFPSLLASAIILRKGTAPTHTRGMRALIDNPAVERAPGAKFLCGARSTCQPPQPWNGCLTAAKAIRMRTRQAAATPTTLIIKTISCATYLRKNLLNLREIVSVRMAIVKNR